MSVHVTSIDVEENASCSHSSYIAYLFHDPNHPKVRFEFRDLTFSTMAAHSNIYLQIHQISLHLFILYFIIKCFLRLPSCLQLIICQSESLFNYDHYIFLQISKQCGYGSMYWIDMLKFFADFCYRSSHSLHDPIQSNTLFLLMKHVLSHVREKNGGSW